MRPYSICCKPQLDVFEERKVEASRRSKLLNLPSISMLVLFYYRELTWSTGKFPISNKTSGAWPASCSALERDRERPASQVGGCKPLGQSEYKPFKYTCTAPPRLRGLLVYARGFFKKQCNIAHTRSAFQGVFCTYLSIPCRAGNAFISTSRVRLKKERP